MEKEGTRRIKEKNNKAKHKRRETDDGQKKEKALNEWEITPDDEIPMEMASESQIVRITNSSTIMQQKQNSPSYRQKEKRMMAQYGNINDAQRSRFNESKEADSIRRAKKGDLQKLVCDKHTSACLL